MTVVSLKITNEDFPDIGDVRSGHILVCHGDDKPTEWIPWLESIAREANSLISIYDEYGVPIVYGPEKRSISCLIDFLDAIGLVLDSNYWEGSCISGFYWTGWIKKGQVRAVQAAAKTLIVEIRSLLDRAIRQKVVNDLMKIKSLECFLERTSEESIGLKDRIEATESVVVDLKTQLEAAKAKFASQTLQNFSELLKNLFGFIVQLTMRPNAKCIVGPFAILGDGNLYVLRAVGSSNLPDNVAIEAVLNVAKALQYQIVDVHEKTVIGGWLSGPEYRRIGNSLQDWAYAWRCDKRYKRNFDVLPAQYSQIVVEMASKIGDD